MAEYSLVIYDSVIFQYGGKVHRWANAVERNFVRHAREEAPIRSGELMFGIVGESTKIGPKHWDVHIHSYADHTMYVLRGTTGPIMSRRMWGFRSNSKYDHLAVPRGGAMSGNPLWGRTRGYNMAWLHANGYAMRLRPGNGFGELLRLEVRGQAANNFMGRAASRTAISNPSLRGFYPSANY